MDKLALIGGATLCFLAVAIGAFGSHALSDLLEANGRTSVYELANRYQFYHGLALVLIGVLAQVFSISTKFVSMFMLFGTVVFCGSLYVLSITNVGWLGAVTPLGGVFLLLAWAFLAWKLLGLSKQHV